MLWYKMVMQDLQQHYDNYHNSRDYYHTFTVYTTTILVTTIAMWGYMKVHGVKSRSGCSDDTRSH